MYGNPNDITQLFILYHLHFLFIKIYSHLQSDMTENAEGHVPSSEEETQTFYWHNL